MSPGLPKGARRLMRVGSVAKDVDEELQFHFDQTVEELTASGMTPADARAEARRRFGDERHYRRSLHSIDHRTARTRRWLERVDATAQMAQEAVSSICRAPSLALGIILAFALGIGANATMFGIIDRLLLRPPAHIADADRVTHLYFESLWENIGDRVAEPTVSYPDFLDMKAAKSFEAVAAVSERTLTIGHGEAAEKMSATLVSDNFFAMLGTRPAAGRFFEPGTDRFGGPREVVISHATWRSAYAEARDVIGRTIDFGHGPYTIVGVAPRGFTGVALADVDMFLPIEAAAEQIQGTDWFAEESGRNWQWLEVYGRLADGASVERATAEASLLHRNARQDDVEEGNWGRDPAVVLGSLIAAKGPNASSDAVVAQLLAGVSLLVLLIACVNVANLLLARTIRQRREIAVRLALGISRYRLVGQLVCEGILLALLGGAAALAIAHWGGGIVRDLLLPDVMWDDSVGEKRVAIAVALIAVLAGVIAAVVPAVQIARRDVADTIREATAGGLTRTTSRVRTSLALAQTVLSVILLIGAGLFVQSLRNVRALDLGLDPRGLASVSPRISIDEEPSEEERARLFARGLERLERTPGVRSAAASATMPFRSRRTRRLRAEGVDSIRRPPSGGPFVHEVSPGYFETMGIDIVSGRGIDQTDVKSAPAVAVVGSTMAQYLWPGANPIGKCLYVGGGENEPPPPCSRIVGVAEDASNIELRDEVGLQYYLALEQMPRVGRFDYWFVRMDGSEQETLQAVRREILALDGRIRYVDAMTFEEVLQPKRQSWELGATLFGLFGVLALTVAAIGLYSVLSFDVAQRTRELGLRTALGATTGTLVRMIVARAVLVTAAGLVIGGSIALLLAPRVRDLLFDTSPRDPATFATVGATLLAVAVMSAAFPAWRAIRVDPNVALRSE